MKSGDLVAMKNGTMLGVVVKTKKHHPDDSNTMIEIAEVLWPVGYRWTEVDMLEKVDD